MIRDEQYLFSGGEDNTIKIWNTETVQCIKTLTGHSAAVMSVGKLSDYILTIDEKEVLNLGLNCRIQRKIDPIKNKMEI